MTEVLFRGEWMDESQANLVLKRECNPNTPEYKRRLEKQAQAKAQAEEERKKLQQQKRAEDRLREKKIEEYLHKFREELPEGYEWSENMKARLLERAHNAYETDRIKEQMRKEQEEEQRKMKESRNNNKPRGFRLLYGRQIQQLQKQKTGYDQPTKSF